MDVLHGDDLSQFIQAVHVLDLIQELHTVEENFKKKIRFLHQLIIGVIIHHFTIHLIPDKGSRYSQDSPYEPCRMSDD